MNTHFCSRPGQGHRTRDISPGHLVLLSLILLGVPMLASALSVADPADLLPGTHRSQGPAGGHRPLPAEDLSRADHRDALSAGQFLALWLSMTPEYGQRAALGYGADDRHGHPAAFVGTSHYPPLAGQVIRQGQVVALRDAGSYPLAAAAGRACYKHGRPIDPASYLSRTLR